MQPLYTFWNSRINVISRKDIGQLYERHVLHSLAIGKLISFRENTKILDVGSGGGFPGIPLAILFPESHFHLVDSIGKKENVSFEQARAEKLQPKYDFIVSRAVTGLPEFTGWVKNRIFTEQKNTLKNGILYLKGGDIATEIRTLQMNASIFPISEFFEEELFRTKSIVHIYR